ncbi:MAG: VCBS repeat-containing protein [Myxococcota bacterium]
MVVSLRSRSLIGTLVLGGACGPSAAPSDGGASGSTTATSGTSSGALSAEASGTTESATDCPESDLPEPFCHVFWPHETLSIPTALLSNVRDGVRPSVVYDRDQSRLLLVNPLDPTEVFVEGPPTVELPPSFTPTVGDIDGDGAEDLAYYAGNDPQEVAVYHGDSLDYWTTVPAGTGFARMVGTVDVDGDDAAELLVAEIDDDGMTFNAFGADGAELQLEQSAQTGVGCIVGAPAQADFNGDGRTDLLFAWPEGCEPYLEASNTPRQVTTVLAASEPSPEMVFSHSPQPVWARDVEVADLDGDRDAELIIVESMDVIVVMNWRDGAFVEQERLSVPAGYHDVTLDQVVAGNFANRGLGSGVFVAPLLPDHEDFVPGEGSFGVLFRADVSPQFMEVAWTGVFYGTDLNDDGAADFFARRDGTPGVFVSTSQ